MITAIRSLGQVQGAWVWLAGWAACAVLYFALLLLPKKHRGKAGSAFLWFLAAELVTDLAWALLYYDGSRYGNGGLQSAGWLLLWPAALTAAGWLAVRRPGSPGRG